MFLEFIARLEDIINAIINSPFKGILLSVITIVALLIIKAISGYFVKRYVYRNAQLETNAQNFMAVWGYIWTAIIAIFGIISLSGSLIVERISKAFMREGQIEFAYVNRETLLTPKDDTVPPQYLRIQSFPERPLTDRIE